MDIFVSHARTSTCPRCRATYAQMMFLADMLEAARRRNAMAIDQSTNNLRQYLEMEAASLNPIYEGTFDCLEQDVDHAAKESIARLKEAIAEEKAVGRERKQFLLGLDENVKKLRDRTKRDAHKAGDAILINLRFLDKDAESEEKE
ncbi:hypothetical protein GCK32_016105 [Trichostrongylus colubriformis]